MSAVLLVFEIKVKPPQLFMLWLHLKVVFDLFLQKRQKLFLIFRPVSKKLRTHIQIAAVCFFVFVQIELIEDSRFILIKDVPADAGIVCDQHTAAHQHFVDCRFSKGNQMDPFAFGLELV